MSGKVAGMVWELELPRQHAWVLMSLADHAEHDGSKVYPGHSLTAWKTGYSVKQVKRITADLLRKYDLLEVVDKGGGNKPAEYRIKVENFANHAKEPPQQRGRPKKTGDTTSNKTGDISEKPGTFERKPGTSTPARVETSVETSFTSSGGGADAPQEQGHGERKQNWFAVYCEPASLVGLPISPEDRQRLPGNLLRCATKEGASEHEMYQVINRRVTRALEGWSLSPQEVLKDVRGGPRNRSAREEIRVREVEL